MVSFFQVYRKKIQIYVAMLFSLAATFLNALRTTAKLENEHQLQQACETGLVPLLT